jgi:hypothetical protein
MTICRRLGGASPTPEPSASWLVLGGTLKDVQPYGSRHRYHGTPNMVHRAQSRAECTSVGVVGGHHFFSAREQTSKLGRVMDESREMLRTDPEIRPLILE